MAKKIKYNPYLLDLINGFFDIDNIEELQKECDCEKNHTCKNKRCHEGCCDTEQYNVKNKDLLNSSVYRNEEDNSIDNFFNHDYEELDLTKDKDLNKFNETIDNLINTWNSNDGFSKLFGDIKEQLNVIKDFAKAYHDNMKEEECKKSSNPSDNIEDINVKLDLHKITEEYFNTVIKPKLDNTEENKKIMNNAYISLFEFICWLFLNKKVNV